MATLQDLKGTLRSNIVHHVSSRQVLSDTQYESGFNVILKGSTTYQSFILPQLSQLLAPLFKSRGRISALEIGPGPRSMLGQLTYHERSNIRRYTAYEPNVLFATRIETWLLANSEEQPPFPALETPPNIQRNPFPRQHGDKNHGHGDHIENEVEKYDIILFCHSLYGMKSKREAIERALNLLARTSDAMVVVFHRDGVLDLDGLLCQKSTLFPTGVVTVADKNEVLDDFCPFIAGFTMKGEGSYETVKIRWREVCRAMGRREDATADRLVFSSPDTMVVFTQHATALPELLAQVSILTGGRTIKNRQACIRRPASIVQPATIQHVQSCVRWALEHNLSLAAIAGGHGGHCVVDNVVSIDLKAFNEMHIVMTDAEKASDLGCDALVVVETGCTTGDVISKTMASGLTVPLGSRPSVGAGSWLQGGLGHLARLHGLACDAIVGAVVVSVSSGQVLCIGCIPSHHQPAASTRPDNEADILWSIKGAGTNCGIVVSVTFKAYKAPLYVVHNWATPLSNGLEAQLKLRQFDELVARKSERNTSADAYLYWDNGQLHLGVSVVQSITAKSIDVNPTCVAATTILGPESSVATVDGVELFETELYVSSMHGGHGGGKTSSFKRCLFVKDIGHRGVAVRLLAAMESRPTPLCYLHLLHGGGAIGDTAIEDAAFRHRDWHFACVVTGVWPRDQDGSKAERAAVDWVYSVAADLLPLSRGVYGADLGPDPRDAALACHAFGLNRRRLAQLKHVLDPQNVLAHACPLTKVPPGPKLIILVTGESCTGKDYCAGLWSSMVTNRHLASRVMSISDAIKRRYAAASGADISRLLSDRAYKEQHRPSLTAFFLAQVHHDSQLPQEQFLNVVRDAGDVDVLMVTGMRDKAPVSTFSHLVSDFKLVEVYMQASERTRQARKGWHINGSDGRTGLEQDRPSSMALDHRPCLIFNNEVEGSKAAEDFFQEHLLPYLDEDLRRLEDMVHQTSDFPRQDIVFRHVLGICQQPGGLALCTSLLKSHFTGDWSNVAAIVCCEVGGIVFGSALALQVNLPMVLIREAGKLPPPTVGAPKLQSYVSSLVGSDAKERRIEMEQNAIPRNSPVVVVDDVLSTGETLGAVLQLLHEAGIGSVDVVVVAEFPIHRGREYVRQRGYGKVNIRSLLTFGGA
ncbi:uncharacterized protein M421DRAFT_52653 [Didymella exigua CBS 183.55]|uniref:FAD-binding PCMH-type domain-containing protein n=1 Tax=Didymella exigua CBS 183.55 TaxID=1150837 RepID=A0A6A5S5L4_9PLEO|nr:uncharacterized protein M421DRAFT_52653 [Didymella exigua CBS 183.55]KAF1933786.1 hypothetical protein M421DRAFT_52653 [Didymella exigua CBS 183.55]